MIAAKDIPQQRPPLAVSRNQRLADILTLICAGTTAFLIIFAIAGPQEGLEALVLIIPWMIAVVVHVISSLPVLVLAWKTGRHLRNTWIFLYFSIFWGVHAAYFVQMNEIDAAFMRQVHQFTRPADAELYRLITRQALRKPNSPPLDLSVKTRALVLIEQGADIHYRPPGSHYNRGALIIWAARSGEPELVAALLDRGAKIEGPGQGSNTPLMAATRMGHTAVVALLLERGADPDNPRYRPATPLIAAVKERHLQAAAALLKGGAGPGYHPPGSAAPLFYASGKGDAAMMKLLLDAGADPNQLYFNRGTSPMIGAVENGCVACVRYLLVAGGKPIGQNSKGDGVVTIVVERGLDEIAALLREAAASRDKATLGAAGTFNDIYRAVKANKWALLQTLFEMGVSPNLVNPQKRTTLSLLAGRQIWRSPDEAAEAVAGKMLIEAGADVDGPDSSGRTPLWHASRSGAVDVTRLLIAVGADVNRATSDGKTPLLNALWKGHPEITAALLSAGADPNARTDWGPNSDYPLRIAASQGQAGTVRLLLASGAIIKPESRQLCDLLQRAAKHPETVQVLAESSVDLNRKDPLGRYPLAVVMRRGDPDSVRALIDAGAYPLLANWRGHQPLNWFAETGEVATLRLCLEKYPDLRENHKLLKKALYRAIRKGQVASVKVLLDYGTFYTRMSEVEAIVNWTKPPPQFPRAKEEILALFNARLAATAPENRTRPSSPVLIVVPRKK